MQFLCSSPPWCFDLQSDWKNMKKTGSPKMSMFQPKSAQASRKSRASFRSKVDPVTHLSSIPALHLRSSNESMPEPRMSVQVGLGCEVAKLCQHAVESINIYIYIILDNWNHVTDVTPKQRPSLRNKLITKTTISVLIHIYIYVYIHIKTIIHNYAYYWGIEIYSIQKASSLLSSFSMDSYGCSQKLLVFQNGKLRFSARWGASSLTF